MAATINRRMTASIEGDFVVFLIGMRINRPWKIHKWLPVAAAMPKMLRELFKKPESGFLGAESNPFLVVQYWRSFEQLEAYAKDTSQSHFPAWVNFNKKVRSNGDVGIWHETYLVRAGEYECIYNNMPPYGLGKATKLIPVSGRLDVAAGRLKAKHEQTNQ